MPEGDLMKLAKDFLLEPSIQQEPLEKKIEFLKKKGLDSKQIERALKGNSPVEKRQPERILYESFRPKLTPERDWRDYFIFATSVCGAMYGAYQFGRRYVVPNLFPESQGKLEQDKKETIENFEKIDLMLNKIEEEQRLMNERENEKLEKLDSCLKDFDCMIQEQKKGKINLENEIKMIKLEMINLQNEVNTFLNDNKDVNELNNIKNEMTSLKLLILNRKERTNDSIAGDDKSNSNHGIPGIKDVPSVNEILSKFAKDEKQVSSWQKLMDPIKEEEETKEEEQEEQSDNNGTTVPDWQREVEEAFLNEQKMAEEDINI